MSFLSRIANHAAAAASTDAERGGHRKGPLLTLGDLVHGARSAPAAAVELQTWNGEEGAHEAFAGSADASTPTASPATHMIQRSSVAHSSVSIPPTSTSMAGSAGTQPLQTEAASNVQPRWHPPVVGQRLIQELTGAASIHAHPPEPGLDLRMPDAVTAVVSATAPTEPAVSDSAWAHVPAAPRTGSSLVRAGNIEPPLEAPCTAAGAWSSAATALGTQDSVPASTRASEPIRAQYLAAMPTAMAAPDDSAPQLQPAVQSLRPAVMTHAVPSQHHAGEMLAAPRSMQSPPASAPLQPMVHIGSLEVSVAAPVESKSAPATPRRGASFSSRHFLRGL